MDITNMHIDDILKKVKRIHFIGIGGAGMCPLAEILIQLGYNVSGSDNNDTETFRRIEKEGAKVYLGQVKENITDDVELVIYTNAILKGMKMCTYFTVLVIMIKNIKTVTITIKEMILNTKMQF